MMSGRAVLGTAVVFSVAMGALSHGGWWWVWLAVIAVLMFGGRLRLFGVRLDPGQRFIARENRRAIRHTRYVVRRERRRERDRRRALRARRRQAQ